MHSNNNAGFTLIEAMLAMVMIAIVFAPLFIMQGSIIQRMYRSTQRMRRMLYADTFLQQARKQVKPGTTQLVFEQKLDDPLTYFTYELKPVSKDASTGDVYQLHVERITARWQEDAQKEQEMLITYTFVGPKQEAQA